MVAKACLAQFDDVEVIRHLWPMVRSEGHLDRVLDDVERRPGPGPLHAGQSARSGASSSSKMPAARHPRGVGARSGDRRARRRCSARRRRAAPGRQHALDAAYFARVDAIQFTIAHDDGVGADNWEEADIVLAGVSRTSKTPTSHLSRQSRLQGREHPARARIAAAADPVRAEASAGRRPHHQSRPADPDPPQPPALAQPGAGDRLCRHARRSMPSSPSPGGCSPTMAGR